MTQPLTWAATSVVLLTVGGVFSAPATAGTLTLGYSLEAQGTFTNQLPPLLNSSFSFLGIDLPSSVLVSTLDPITGTATFLDDPDQYLDGSIDLGFDKINSLIDTSLLNVGPLVGLDPSAFSNLIVLSGLTGGGTLVVEGAEAPASTNFSWNYSDNLLSAVGYDAALVEQCSTANCSVNATLGFSVGLGLAALVDSAPEISAVLGLPEADFADYLTLLSIMTGSDVLSLGSADLSFGLDTQFLSADANGDVGSVGGTVTGGSVSIQTIGFTAVASEPYLLSFASESLPDETPTPETSVPETSAPETPTPETPTPETPPVDDSSTPAPTPSSESLIDTSVEPSQEVPEPGTILGLLSLGGGVAGMLKRKQTV